MIDKRIYVLVSIIALMAMIISGCGAAAPTATPVPPTKAPAVATAVPTKAPAVATVAPTAVPAKPTPFALKVGTDATFKPMEFKDEKTGAIIGFDVDMMNAICVELGCTATFENITFDGIFQALAAKKFDVVASSTTITEQRKKEYLFSDPYVNAGQILAVRQDEKLITSIDSITKTTRIGVQLGTTGEEEGKKFAQKTGATVKSFDDITLALADLAAGRLDCVINDVPITSDYIASNPDAKLKMVGKVFTEEFYGITLRKDDTAMQAKINEALKKLTASGKMAELQKKWGLAQ